MNFNFSIYYLKFVYSNTIFFLKEARTYIDGIRSKFGNFELAKDADPFEPEKVQDCLKQMIVKHPSSSCIASIKTVDVETRNSESENFKESTVKNNGNESNANTIRKRNAESNSTESPSAKKACDETYDFGKVLRILSQMNNNHMENIKKIVKLQQERYSLASENKNLEQNIAALEETNRNDTEKFDDAKTVLEKMIDGIKKAKIKEKERFEDEKKALEQIISTFVGKIAALEAEL